MTFSTRLARATACAALLAIPATAVADQATIRIEGTTGTVFPETAYVLPAPGSNLTIHDTVDGDTMPVGGRTAAAQLGNASRLHGFGFRFTDWGQWGFALDQIGVDASDWNSGPAWFLKHNHRLAAVGAGSLQLAPGDEVLWALSPLDGNWDMALAELEVVAPTAPMPTGTSFTVRVNSYDNAGTRTPASGATVTYAGRSANAGADGTVSFTSTGSGAMQVVATQTGAVRDNARTCTFPTGNPEICDLPPLPTATMPDAPPAGQADTIRLPVSVTIGGMKVTVVADVPLPEQGEAPVAIRRQMIGGADLSPTEMRRAMGAVASALAATLNQRAGAGEARLALSQGVSWQPAWLSGTPYVVPLRRTEALLGARSGGPRNTRAMDDRAADLRRHIKRCELEGTATRTRRHGYALTVVSPAAIRDDLVDCVREGR